MADSTPYRVLARKYRPLTFADLIGQEPMVRTLTNAFAQNRIHQAYIFTGVRGVGKTTTARILARAFNYENMDGTGGPTIDLSVPGRHCQAIIDGRHPDVVEMDAASNTGIDNIRDVIESAQYRPISARYKVLFIIDEVHMLSKQAFNGLLKTLEEPPPHVKVPVRDHGNRKVLVTVLSPASASICAGWRPPRWSAISPASARRRMSRWRRRRCASSPAPRKARCATAFRCLIRRFAHGAGGAPVSAEDIRGMLGLADRTRVLDLFELVMKGDVPAALALLKDQYDGGADPAVLIADLAETVHMVTRLKLAPDSAKDDGLSESERSRGLAFSRDLPIRVLTRAWQLLLKGIKEVQEAERPIRRRKCCWCAWPMPPICRRRMRRSSCCSPAPWAMMGAGPCRRARAVAAARPWRWVRIGQSSPVPIDAVARAG